jgi:hypothetical protein
MIGLLCFVLAVVTSPFKSRLRLEAENAALRHQLMVLRRRLQGRVRLTNHDRWFLIQLYRWFPSILSVLTIIRPETLVRWHRAGFRCYWRWKSRSLGGRPQIDTELRVLIRRISIENPLWGAPRIHGELLKLGFEVAQSTVAKYMVKRREPPSQGWRIFLVAISVLTCRSWRYPQATARVGLVSRVPSRRPVSRPRMICSASLMMRSISSLTVGMSWIRPTTSPQLHAPASI